MPTMPTHCEWMTAPASGEKAHPDDVINNITKLNDVTPDHVTTNGSINNNDPCLPEQKSGAKLVGVDGKWYDVTTFMARHPGGPIIERYVGKDATHVFHAMGHKNVLKYRRPVGTYTMPDYHEADADFRALETYFREKGYFETDWSFVYKKMILCAILLSFSFACVILSNDTYIHYLGACFLTIFWQQCGFFMHDFMHNQVFRNSKKDQLFGTIFGTFFFGISASWWRDEHFIHHSITNNVDEATNFVDPQMWEDVWVQHPKLFPFHKGYLAYLLIKIQHITFIPITTFLGRIGIILDSFRAERRWHEWLAGAAHWTWVCFLLSWLPTWPEVFKFYFLAGSCQGILHFQLVFSHYCKPFYELKEFLHNSWYVQQIECNLNIENPVWLDWFHGGLNFHIEHHLFPLMARHKLRDASPKIRAVCDKHGIVYDSSGFWAIMARTLRSLKNTSHHYTLDPR